MNSTARESWQQMADSGQHFAASQKILLMGLDGSEVLNELNLDDGELATVA